MIRRQDIDKRLRDLPSDLVGRAYSTNDPEQRQQFIDWLLDITSQLGLRLKQDRR